MHSAGDQEREGEDRGRHAHRGYHSVIGASRRRARSQRPQERLEQVRELGRARLPGVELLLDVRPGEAVGKPVDDQVGESPAARPCARATHAQARASGLRGPCTGESVAEVGGVNVHAGPAIDGRDRRRLERLCRYVARPPVAQERLELSRIANVW
ncbi:transposase, partial [Pseudenhygromyxa sp. WMMC2535]|nr:transposase [Pseudenhygromyxa sp. WMMC2535]